MSGSVRLTVGSARQCMEFERPTTFLSAIQDHHDGARTNASMLHNVLKHQQTLIALLSEHTGGLVWDKNRTLFCVVDRQPNGRQQQLDTKRETVTSSGWTCGYVPSVDFCVVVGITKLHFKQTMRSRLELRTKQPQF